MSDFNERVIAEFRANEGRVGGPFASMPLVLLHHRGAKSGVERISPLATYPVGDDLVIIASAGGQPQHPAWYHNLLAHPETVIEYGTETRPVTASVVGDDEHDELWARITAVMPGFQTYQDGVERRIPLVRLRRR